MAKELKIKVIGVRDVTTRDGRKFKAYSCLDDKGKAMDLKFVRSAHNVPTERCYIFVDSDKVNVSRRGDYPVTWVKDVNRIEPLQKETTNAEDYFSSADDEEASPFC